MSKDQVRIGVGVDGDEKSKQDLRRVAAELERFDREQAEATRGSDKAAAAAKRQAAAQEQQAKATRKAATETDAASKQAAGGLDDIDDSAKSAAAGLLGTLHPALGSISSLFVDLLKSLGKFNPMLLATVGAGAALGVLVTGFNRIAEAAERARQAILRQRAALAEKTLGGIEQRLQSEADLLAAGVTPETAAVNAVMARRRSMGMRGTPADVARAAATAEAAGLISGDQVEQYAAGVALQGAPGLTTDQRANRKAVEAVLKAGSTAGAQQALEALRHGATGLQARSEAPKREALSFDAPELREIAISSLRERGDLSDSELDALRLFYAGQPGRDVSWSRRFFLPRRGSGPSSGRYSYHFGDHLTAAPVAWERVRPDDSDRTYGELVEVVKQAMQDLGSELSNRSPETPVTVNIHQHTNQTNIGTSFISPRDLQEQMARGMQDGPGWANE